MDQNVAIGTSENLQADKRIESSERKKDNSNNIKQ